MASSSSSISSFLSWIHDVFLSFRGEDTRKAFVSHLYAELLRQGIITFKDDEGLDKGNPISPALLKAIEDSRFAIVVISANYASSGWCLEELAKIVERAKHGFLTVVPIFYEVDPSHVRKQEGSFGEALKEHEEKNRHDLAKVKKWREALTYVANIAGEDSRTWKDEANGIQNLVGKISSELFSMPSGEMDNLVGMEAPLKDLAILLCLSDDKPRFIGIWGMGGIGKTTIATCLYERYSCQFQAHCFIGVSGIYGVRDLQKLLLSNILPGLRIPQSSFNSVKARLGPRGPLVGFKVLVVIDDVDKSDQLKALARSIDWFGLGSRIIITTRNKRLLVAHGVEHMYEVKCLIGDEALQLFCQHAFRQKHPSYGFENLSIQVAHHTGGLPFALEVLGEFLRGSSKEDCGSSKEDWESALSRLRKIPHEDVLEKLKVSYDSLADDFKSIFLHVACLFIPCYSNIDDVKKVLDACGYDTQIGISVLMERSLLQGFERCYMHGLLMQMGRYIVHQQSTKPGERRFLMDYSDFHDVLTNNMGAEAVEGIYLPALIEDEELEGSEDMRLDPGSEDGEFEGTESMCSDSSSEDGEFEGIGGVCLDPGSEDGEFEGTDVLNISDDAFERMPNLQILIISDYLFPYIEKHFPRGLSYLPKKLKLLKWAHYPLQALPSGFCPNFLVILEMPNSKLEKLWEGIQSLGNLRKINLKGSRNLKELPDLSTAINLEELNLHNCQNLEEIHSSVEGLEKLILLNLGGCLRLDSMPYISSRWLKLLCLSYWESWRKSPECWMKGGPLMPNLGGSAILIEQLPPWMMDKSCLVELTMGDHCNKLRNLPSTIDNLTALKTLRLEDCPMLTNLPNAIQKLRSLETLKIINGRSITEFPCVPQNIKTLILTGSSIEDVPSWIGKLSKLECLDLSSSESLKSAPADIFRLKKLANLDLEGCQNLESFPSDTLETTSCQENQKDAPTLSRISNRMNMRGCRSLRNLPRVIQNPLPFWAVDLGGCELLEDLGDIIENCKFLGSLKIDGCPKITKFPDLPSSLIYLTIKGCSIEEVPSWIRKLSELQSLDLSSNERLKSVRADIFRLKRLADLNLEGCQNLESFSSDTPETTSCQENQNDASALFRSVCLNMTGCRKLRNLPRVIQNPHPFKTMNLDLSGCKMLEDLGENWRFLRSLIIDGCPRITRFPGLPSSLISLTMKRCSIEEVPLWIGKLSKLESLDLSFNKRLKSVPADTFRLEKLTNLNLEGCHNLEGFPSDIPETTSCQENQKDAPTLLRRLSRLNMKGCRRLRKLPRVIQNSLPFKVVDLSGCKMLEDLPDTVENWKFLTYLKIVGSPRITRFLGLPSSLERLTIEGTSIDEIPTWIEKLSRLRYLHLASNSRLKSIPIAIFKLGALEELDLSCCTNLQSLPPEIPDQSTSFLKILDIRGTRIRRLPTNLWRIISLLTLHPDSSFMMHRVSYCRPFSSISGVHLLAENTLQKPLLNAKNVKDFELCKHRYISNGVPVQCPSLSAFVGLKKLCLANLNLLEFPNDLSDLGNLEDLDLRGNDFKQISSNIECLSHLKSLDLSDCQKLRSLPALPESLEALYANGCISLEEASSGFKPEFQVVDLGNCFKLHRNDELLVKNMAYTKLFEKGIRRRILLPGSQMPCSLDWKASRPVITIPLPQGRTVSEVVGFVACVVVNAKDQQFRGFCKPIACKIEAKLAGKHLADSFVSFPLSKAEMARSFDLESDHLFLFNNSWKVDEEVDRAVASDAISFKFILKSPFLARRTGYIKECGICLLFREDIERCAEVEEKLMPTGYPIIRSSEEAGTSSLLELGLPIVADATTCLDKLTPEKSVSKIKRCREPECSQNGESDETQEDAKRVKFMQFL